MKKGSWKDYISFTKRERNAGIIFLCILAIFFILPFYFKRTFVKPAIDAELQQQLIDLQKPDAVTTALDTGETYHTTDAATIPANYTLFYFDPNTLDAAGFAKLGIGERTIKTIINYRNKGGRFKTPEDIRKIYGLKNDDADRLVPYIKLANTREAEKPKIVASKQITKIDINTATEDEWKALPGIGDVLAARIVKFRYKLGGFSSVEEVKKTYGLSDSTYQMILPYLLLKKESE